MASKGAFSPKTKEILLARSGGRCDMCGIAVQHPHFHHRRARGMGGSGRDSTAGAENGLVLHPACHDKVESHRDIAHYFGWLVRQSSEPSEEPVKMHDGWWLLDRFGGRHAVTQDG